jgi:hypothetical protein
MAPTDPGGTGSLGEPPPDREPRPGPRALQAIQEAVRRVREQGGPLAADRSSSSPSTLVAGSAAVARATLPPASRPGGDDVTQMHLSAVGASGDPFGAGPPTATGEDVTVQPTTLRQPAGVPVDERSPTRMAPASPPPPDSPEPIDPGGRSSVDSALRASVLVVGAIVVALVAWLVVVHLRGTSAPAGTPAAAHHGSAAPNGAPRHRTHATTPAPSGSRPEITSITPDRGAAGQVVTVIGVNLFSPDGNVQVFFGGAGAATSCSTATTCQATVPTAAPGKVRVTVVTQAGTSNSVTFTAT